MEATTWKPQLGSDNLEATTWKRQLGSNIMESTTWKRQRGSDNLEATKWKRGGGEQIKNDRRYKTTIVRLPQSIALLSVTVQQEPPSSPPALKLKRRSGRDKVEVTTWKRQRVPLIDFCQTNETVFVRRWNNLPVPSICKGALLC